MDSFGKGKQERGEGASHMSQFDRNGMCMPGTVSYEDGEVWSGAG